MFYITYYTYVMHHITFTNNIFYIYILYDIHIMKYISYIRSIAYTWFSKALVGHRIQPF